MTGKETWKKIQPILWALQDIADEGWQEIYVNVYNGLKKLDEEEKHDNISDSYYNGIGANTNR